MPACQTHRLPRRNPESNHEYGTDNRDVTATPFAITLADVLSNRVASMAQYASAMAVARCRLCRSAVAGRVIERKPVCDHYQRNQRSLLSGRTSDRIQL